MNLEKEQYLYEELESGKELCRRPQKTYSL